MQKWPLDGLIGFWTLVIALACIIGGMLIKRKGEDIAPLEQGFFVMKPLLSAKVTALGMVLMLPVMTYALWQSGFCGKMTHEANVKNTMVGVVVVTAFWVAVSYCLYGFFGVKRMFNAEKIVSRSILGHSREWLWSDLADIGKSWGGVCINFAQGGRFFIPLGVSGVQQLHILARLSLLGVDVPPPHPRVSDELIEYTRGKYVLGVVHHIDENLGVASISEFLGGVEAVSSQGIEIAVTRQEEVSHLRVPLNFHPFAMTVKDEQQLMAWRGADLIPVMIDKYPLLVAIFYTRKEKLFEEERTV